MPKSSEYIQSYDHDTAGILYFKYLAYIFVSHQMLVNSSSQPMHAMQ